MRATFARVLSCLALSAACGPLAFAQTSAPLLNALSKSAQPAQAPAAAPAAVDPVTEAPEQRLAALAAQLADIEKRYDATRTDLIKSQNALKDIRDPATPAYTALADRVAALQAQVDYDTKALAFLEKEHARQSIKHSTSSGRVAICCCTKSATPPWRR